ncbi:metallophosphoesterase family protein [Roseitranquillus sediminis]|uniref:metallophosphoesterase family protein n=1 Tax=Roseitranquillus sediminis TaxID=2809051 RepID=UPI001D0CB6EF|nr:metallophosphoesterase family protein [Roseitranquillus sediminis]MBM9596266.1 metallophosphoesterase family protein [Roseitranquillus sediminis]
MILGVISDTHGHLRPEARAALSGVDLILHAGDFGRPEVMSELEQIAPSRFIRGNVDTAPWAQGLPETATLAVGGRRIHMLHDVKELDFDPRAEGFDAVVAGHSHRPSAEVRNGVLYLNPGSAGPRRFRLPVTLARLDTSDMSARILTLLP